MKIYTVVETFKEDNCVEPWKHSYPSWDSAKRAIVKNVNENWEELKIFWMMPGLAMVAAEGGEPSIEYQITATELQDE